MPLHTSPPLYLFNFLPLTIPTWLSLEFLGWTDICEYLDLRGRRRWQEAGEDLDIIRVNKTMIRWVGHIAHTAEIRNGHRILLSLAPQPSPGLGLLHKIRLNFLEASQQFSFLQGRVVSPTPNPHPGGPGLCIYIPQKQGGYPF
jgi:hypothetical protein